MVYLARHIFILPFLEDLISSHFLFDPSDRPTLLELESKAGKVDLRHFYNNFSFMEMV